MDANSCSVLWHTSSAQKAAELLGHRKQCTVVADWHCSSGCRSTGLSSEASHCMSYHGTATTTPCADTSTCVITQHMLWDGCTWVGGWVAHGM